MKRISASKEKKKYENVCACVKEKVKIICVLL